MSLHEIVSFILQMGIFIGILAGILAFIICMR